MKSVKRETEKVPQGHDKAEGFPGIEEQKRL